MTRFSAAIAVIATLTLAHLLPAGQKTLPPPFPVASKPDPRLREIQDRIRFHLAASVRLHLAKNLPETLKSLESYIGTLLELRGTLSETHGQSARTLEQLEDVREQLAQARIRLGELTRRLHHNKPESAKPRLSGIPVRVGAADLVVAISANADPARLVGNDKKTGVAFPLALILRSEIPEAFGDISFVRGDVRNALREDQSETLSALGSALEDRITVMTLRRDRFAARVQEQTVGLEHLERAQEALGAAQLDCGLFEQVLLARKEVARLAADVAAGRTTQADLARAQGRLSAAEVRLATEASFASR